jgi:hypothetical protein
MGFDPHEFSHWLKTSKTSTKFCNNRTFFLLSDRYDVAEFRDTKHAPQPLFVTTPWSVVLTAQDKSSSDSAVALEIPCRAYWYPLNAYVRGTGRSPHDDQDLTQEFFARLLAQDWLRVVLPEKGRFRTFLIVVE